MNLEELRKGLGNADLNDADLDQLQSLYLVDDSLSKEDFYKIVKAIGVTKAEHLSMKINVLYELHRKNDLEISSKNRRIDELKLELNGTEREYACCRKMNEAFIQDLNEANAALGKLRDRHGRLVAFVQSLPGARDEFLAQRSRQAEDEFEDIMRTGQ